MGTQSKSKKRQMNFSDALKALSENLDTKFLENTGQFTQLMSSFKLRLEVLEDLLMEKFQETEDSFKERLLLRVEKNQGFQEVGAWRDRYGGVVRND